MIPTFLCIGGQRCGTTWLHSVLDHLPNVHVCKSKETDFFYANILRQDVGTYEANFDPPAGRWPCEVRGELSPNYCMLKRPSVELIRKLYPRLRLLLVIRDPVERALSQTWLDLRYMSGHIKQGPLALGEYLRHVERQRTRRRGDYARIIRTWREVFGPEALHIELYDDLCADPAGFVRRVLRHLGTDDTVALSPSLLQRKVFESARAQVPPLVRWYLAREYRQKVRQLNDLLAGRVAHWLTAIDESLAPAPMHWQVLRGLNKWVLSVPEKIAYAAYDGWRDQRLAHRNRQVLIRRPVEPANVTPPAGNRQTGLHKDTTPMSTR
jgi:hypothetical protein